MEAVTVMVRTQAQTSSFGFGENLRSTGTAGSRRRRALSWAMGPGRWTGSGFCTGLDFPGVSALNRLKLTPRRLPSATRIEDALWLRQVGMEPL
jgi:hypothetical protein